MKLLRYGPAGQEKPGLLDADGTIRDLSAHIADLAGGNLGPDVLARIAALEPATLPAVEAGVRIGPCVGRVGNFIAVGLNYADHAAESGMAVPAEPVLFNKAPSSICGPDDDVIMPSGATKLDWEVELAVVIGSEAFCISEAEALQHVAGFCICNDVSERAWQLERGGNWMKGKSAPTFGPLGPWLVTRDEIDPDVLSMILRVNGQTVQNGSTRTMIFRVPYIVHYISQFMRLMPGDVITTGTPPGVGMGFKPPRYLKQGDIMELNITGLGRQQQNVRLAKPRVQAI